MAQLAVVQLLFALAQAYSARQQDVDALHPGERLQQRDASHELNIRFQRGDGFHAGVPVPSGWYPRMETVSFTHALPKRASVAKLAEQHAAPEATITYVDSPDLTFSSFVRFGKHTQAPALSLGRRASEPRVEPVIPGKSSWDEGAAKQKEAEAKHNEELSDAWVTNSASQAQKRAKDYVKQRAFTEAAKKEAEADAKARGTWNETKAMEEANTWPKKTGISRCGFSWDDAAAKMGEWCSSMPGTPACAAPPGISDDTNSYWFNQSYQCYTDLPDIGVRAGGRVCHAISKASSDTWCLETCNSGGVNCDPVYCSCADDGTGLEDMEGFKTEDTFDVTAPIQPHDASISAIALPNITEKLLEQVIRAGKQQPSGLPDCAWRPGSALPSPPGPLSGPCSNESQYECMQGAAKGRCSHFNWFDRPTECEASCVHTLLLRPAPYYALWYPGPLAKEFRNFEQQPRYKHAASRFALRVRGIYTEKSDVMMSGICKSQSNHFVGVSMYSPMYKDKAERLLRSCARVGVCCKATLLPSDAFGPNAPEGSEDFRYEAISLKPSFIRDELDNTQLPVVFLDIDLEFQSFPPLFVPGSWPNGGRDVAIFNYWGNESDWEHASTPTTGSGVVFFNQTRRARNVLTAWAEAMAWPENIKAPDDQVFDTILKKGGWLARASYGWLPSSYLRTMPAYYRGVAPVIDHDHANAPGILNHSTIQPKLPPVERMELCDPQHDGPTHQHEPAPIPRDDTDEPLAAEAATGAETKDTTLRLPAGTCKSNNPSLRSDPTAERYWHNWCDVNCLPSRWGAVGEGGCRDGSETGVVGCVCKQGVTPVESAAVERGMKAVVAKAEAEGAQAEARVAKQAAAAVERHAAVEAERQRAVMKEEAQRMEDELRRAGMAADGGTLGSDHAEKTQAEKELWQTAEEAELEARRAGEEEGVKRAAADEARRRATEGKMMRNRAETIGTLSKEVAQKAEEEENGRVTQAEDEVREAVAERRKWTNKAKNKRAAASQWSTAASGGSKSPASPEAQPAKRCTSILLTVTDEWCATACTTSCPPAAALWCRCGEPIKKGVAPSAPAPATPKQLRRDLDTIWAVDAQTEAATQFTNARAMAPAHTSVSQAAPTELVPSAMSKQPKEHSAYYNCKFLGTQCDESNHTTANQTSHANVTGSKIVGDGGAETRVVVADEQSGLQVAPEAADSVPVVVVQPDPEVAPGVGVCTATNPDMPKASRANWDLWCASTCNTSPASCASPALTGTAACVCVPGQAR